MFSKLRLSVPLAAIVMVVSWGSFVSADQLWDFWTGSANPNGFTEISGGAHFRTGDGDGVTPANSGGGYAHDGGHANFIYRSPEFNFSGTGASGDLGGGTVMSFQTGGGAGDQNGLGPGFYPDPASVMAYNGGNTNNTGQKGLAFYNVDTDSYDAMFFDTADGGTETQNFTAPQLTSAGVDLAQNYQIDLIETDDGGWGWGQWNFINLAAGDPVTGGGPGGGGGVPEPSSMAIWSIAGMVLAGLGYYRYRRQK